MYKSDPGKYDETQARLIDLYQQQSRFHSAAKLLMRQLQTLESNDEKALLRVKIMKLLQSQSEVIFAKHV